MLESQFSFQHHAVAGATLDRGQCGPMNHHDHPHARDVRIRELREAIGLTQEALASRVGVNRDTIWRWEIGQSVPQRRFRVSLARRLGVSIEELGLPHPTTSDGQTE